ncbi:MAG: ABC transporter ATP-binding protein [Clostridium sp.]
MEDIIKIRNLNKTYGEKHVLNNFSVGFKKGQIYGVVGRSGTGKTTLLRSLLNMTFKDSGEVIICGKEINNYTYEHIEDIGYLIGNEFYQSLTVKENLELHLEYYGFYKKEEISRCLKLVNLLEYENSKIKELSAGMLQKLAFVRAIITTPKILILDEPFNSIDYKDISLIRNIVCELNEVYGVTVILTSHILSEIEVIAHNIIFIEDGQVTKEMETNNNEIFNDYIVLKCDNPSKAIMLLERVLKISTARLIKGNDISITAWDDTSIISKLLVENNINVLELYKKKVTLEKYLTETI